MTELPPHPHVPLGSPHAAPFRGTGPFLAKAPPLSIPMRHFGFAAASFWLFAAAFAWGHDRFLGFDFRALWVLGLTHLLTLGWVTMTILGAMSQLAPVLWEVSLFSPRAIRLAWWAFAIGIIGFVGHLWTNEDRYWIPAALVVAALIVYIYVFLRTMRSALKLDWTGKHLVVSVGYLSAVIVLGLLLAYDRERGYLFSDPRGVLIAHLHLALIGWVSMTIIGVSYRLVSMFALSHLESKTPGRLTLALGNIGLIGLAADALFFRHRHLPIWAALLAAAYAAYAWQMREIFRSRNRRIDPALAYTLLALLGGAVWTALGVGLAFGWLEGDTHVYIAYLFAALVGWVTPFILGQIHKIVPFLVWLHVYSPRQWKPPLKIPKIQDLTSPTLSWIEFATMAVSIYVSLGGFLAQSVSALGVGSALMLVAATLYVVNNGISLSHLVWRRAEWTSSDTPS